MAVWAPVTPEQIAAEQARWHPPLSEVEAALIERGYKHFTPNPTIDRYAHLWQRRSGVVKEFDGDIERGFIDVKVYDFSAHGWPLSYEVGTTFETPHGWIQSYFYSLNGRNLLDRLPALEAEVRALQERLMGEEVRE